MIAIDLLQHTPEDNRLQQFMFCEDLNLKKKHCTKFVPHEATQLQVLLNEKAKEVASRQYKLSPSGSTISADKVYVCTGGKPNTAFLQGLSIRSILDQRGYVQVSIFLASC